MEKNKSKWRRLSMSMNRCDYLIVGYDLTEFKNDLLTKEWCENPENEKWECYQKKGEIQAFTDPCSGNHLYFGYILAESDEFYCEDTTISVEYVEKNKNSVDEKLNETGWLENLPERARLNYQMIYFSEYR